MGHVKIDVHAKDRKYTQKYALNAADGVRSLLRDRHRIAARREKGDYAASDIIIDLHSAIESAGLTDRQAEAVGLVYGFDLTLEQAGRVMDITKQGVKAFIDGAAERIAAVYKRWNYEEITVELDGEEDAANDGEKA